MPGNAGTTCLSTGSSDGVLAQRVDGRVDDARCPPARRPCRRPAAAHSAAAHGQAHRHHGVVLGGELVEGALDGRHPVGPGRPVQVLPAGAVAGQQRHLDGVAARGEVLGPRTHRDGAAGEAVLDEHADAAPAGELRRRRRGHRGDEGGVDGRGRGAAEGDLHGGQSAACNRRRGYRERVTTPGDESRTELAWREIVEHYGERPVLPDDDATARPAATPGRARSTPAPSRASRRPRRRRRRRRTWTELPEVDRFRPPAAPPFPRPAPGSAVSRGPASSWRRCSPW